MIQSLILGVIGLTLLRAAFAPDPDPRVILGDLLTGGAAAGRRAIGTASARR